MNKKRSLFSLVLVPLAASSLLACDADDDSVEVYEDEFAAEEQAELDSVAEVLQGMLEDGSAESFPHPDEVDFQFTARGGVMNWFTVEEVRLRHAASGKCIYGNAVEDGAIHNWVCWNDPGMTYSVYTHTLSDTKFLIHKNTGKYIESYGSNGATVTNRSGGNPYQPMRFVFDDAGGGAVRIRNASTGQCLYGTNANGGTVHNWGCWSDPGMAFYIDPV